MNNLFIFSGGGTVTDEDIVTPFKGDIATTTNMENKVPTNPQQLLVTGVNMHLSATMAILELFPLTR